MGRYDTAIIGSGPAGISAAVTAKLRGKNIILLGSRDLSPKIRKAPRILNYPGLYDVTGEELCERFSEHLKALDITVTEKRAGLICPLGDYFGIQADEDIIEAKTVILAAGAAGTKPLKGEEEFLGKGVSICATCDGPLCRGKDIIVIGYSRQQESEAKYLASLAGAFTYIPVYSMEEELFTGEDQAVLKEVPQEIFGDVRARGIKTKNGGVYEADAVFVLRDSTIPSQLVPGLKTDENRVIVTVDMETNIPGLFACGDIAGEPYQYVKAAGQGNTAALSAVKYISRMEQGV